MKKLQSIFLLGILVTICNSQDLYHNSKIRWSTIQTKHFDVHIPSEKIKIGLQIADICEEIYYTVSQSLDYFPNKTQVVVHTERVDYNGFTTLFPWRMELFISPPQSNIPAKNANWLKSLIIHEFTHVVHLRKHKGVTSLTKTLFGEYNSLSQMITPYWFVEGIATLNETRFTNGGRGRNPYFWMQMSEPIYSGEPWKINNTNFNSRTRTPTTLMPYISGYYLTENIVQSYSEYAWGRILNRYTTIPILGFENAVKYVTNKKSKTFYNKVINNFETDNLISKKYTDYDIWYNSNKIEDQYSPRWLDNDNIIFYQKSLDAPRKIVKINRQGEKETILNRQITKTENCLAVGNGKIYTSEKHSSVKFSAIQYSDLYVYNTSSNERTRLTDKKHLYSIDISPDASKLIAVESNLPYNQLAIIDVNSKKIVQNISINNYAILNPRWSPSGKQITFALLDSNGVANIAIYNTQNNQWRFLSKPNLNQDNQPCWSKDENFIYYTSDKSGIFNIWAVEVSTGKTWQITNVEFGAFTPDVSPTGEELAFAIYSKDGFRIAVENINRSTWISSEMVVNENRQLYDRGEIAFSEVKLVDDLAYSIVPYSSFSQVVKPQGWIPYIFEEEHGMGIATYLRSEDALNRHKWFGKLGFSLENYTPSFDLNYKYTRYWPKFSLRTYSMPKKYKNNDTIWRRDTGIELSGTLPFILEDNVYKMISYLSVGLIQNQFTLSKSSSNIDNNLYRGIKFDFQIQRTINTIKNITPYLGWFFNSKFELSNSTLMSDYSTKRFSADLDIFIPAVRSSNLELYIGYLFRYGNYSYSNNYLPIGFVDSNLPNQIRFSTAYYIPLAYIEWQPSLIPIYIDYIYIKPFIDMGSGFEKNKSISSFERVNSIGVRVATQNILFYRYKFEAGVNLYKKSNTNRFKYNPFLRFNF